MRIKGFDKNLRCLGMQYEIGKEYQTDAEHITSDDLCTDKVFHYCDSLKNVHYFYPCQPYKKNRYCEIEVLGEEVTDGKKYGSNHIKIVREITGMVLKNEKVYLDSNYLGEDLISYHHAKNFFLNITDLNIIRNFSSISKNNNVINSLINKNILIKGNDNAGYKI